MLRDSVLLQCQRIVYWRCHVGQTMHPVWIVTGVQSTLSTSFRRMITHCLNLSPYWSLSEEPHYCRYLGSNGCQTESRFPVYVICPPGILKTYRWCRSSIWDSIFPSLGMWCLRQPCQLWRHNPQGVPYYSHLGSQRLCVIVSWNIIIIWLRDVTPTSWRYCLYRCIPPCFYRFSLLAYSLFFFRFMAVSNFFFNLPVHGEGVGVHILDIYVLRSGIAFVVEEEAVGLWRHCRVIFVFLCKFIPHAIQKGGVLPPVISLE